MEEQAEIEPKVVGLISDTQGKSVLMSKLLATPEQAAQDAKDELIESRTNAFKELFDKMDEFEIPLEGREATAIARNATSEFGITNVVSNLADLKVEELSNYEFKRILARARTAIKRVAELRHKFSPILAVDPTTGEKAPSGRVAGPYYTNRKMKRGMKKRLVKNSRASNRSSRASRVLLVQKATRDLVNFLSSKSGMENAGTNNAPVL